MSQKHQHTKILDRVAKSILTPHGIKQKGRSRIWLGDHGYWLVVVEFQPSSWSRGSYLNVGCMWLFYPKDYISFDFGHREKSFIQYTNDEQFERVSEELSNEAVEKVLEYRERFSSLADIQSHLVSIARPENWWSFYHAAVASGLRGTSEQASYHFSELIEKSPETGWHRELQKRSVDCLRTLQDRAAFRKLIRSFANHTRQALRLEAVQSLLE